MKVLETLSDEQGEEEATDDNYNELDSLFDQMSDKINIVCKIIRFWNYGLDLRKLFKEVDRSGDGLLSLDEIYSW